jgi:hypothetical protein
MKAGSFWPSPSSVQTMSARAWRTPVRTAADWPVLALVVGSAAARGASRQIGQHRAGAVGRAIVDVDHLVGTEREHRLGNLGDQRGDIVLLVLDGHDDGNNGARGGGLWLMENPDPARF